MITEGQTSVGWPWASRVQDEAGMHPISAEGARLGSPPEIHPSSTAKSSFSFQSKPHLSHSTDQAHAAVPNHPAIAPDTAVLSWLGGKLLIRALTLQKK